SDFRASMGLLIAWLSQAERTPLEDGEHSFATLVLRWMLGLTAQAREIATSPLPFSPEGERGRGEEATNRGRLSPTGEDGWPLIRRLFDYVDANAEEYGQVPSLDGAVPGAPVPEEEEGAGLYGAAYEDFTYKDSASDGTDGELADDGPKSEPFNLEEENALLEKRLRFVSTHARLWT